MSVSAFRLPPLRFTASSNVTESFRPESTYVTPQAALNEEVVM